MRSREFRSAHLHGHGTGRSNGGSFILVLSGVTPPVAVFDASWPLALAFTRGLGHIGVPVEIYSHIRFPACRWSRYVTRFARCPDPNDIDSFQEWLDKKLAAGEIALVAPTSDLILYHMAVVPTRPPVLRRSMASPEQVMSVVFKDLFEETCEQLGVARPRTLLLRGREDLAAARDLRFPVVLKPRSHVGLGGVRGRVVRTHRELERVLAPYPIQPGARSLLEKHPNLTWPLVQELVADLHKGLFSIGGILGCEGRLLGAGVCRKWAQWPATLGIGTLFEGVDEPEVAENALEVVRKFLQAGLFELELARDTRTGRLLALDLNARGYGQMSLAMVGGLHLPQLWYRTSVGERVPETEATQIEDLTWVHPFLYEIGSMIECWRPEGRRLRRRRAAALRKRPVRAGADWKDPVASGAFLLWLARQSVGIARRHLRPDV